MTTPKLLGESAPNAATLTTLYTAPGCCRATIDTLTICNRSAVAVTFRISVAPKGAADAVAHYLYPEPIFSSFMDWHPLWICHFKFTKLVAALTAVVAIASISPPRTRDALIGKRPSPL